MRRQLTLVLFMVVVAACSSSTGPEIDDDGDTDNDRTGAAVLRSLTAKPPTIVEGDEFTLEWQGQNGTVSLARKGSVAFIAGLPSSGSYVVRRGTAGYPTAVGETSYEAAIGDVALRRETTVTMNPQATPQPTPQPTDNRPPAVRVSADPTSCHPTRGASSEPPTPCTATCTATASDPENDALTYSWSGCASGAAATATCSVAAISEHTCSVAVSDGHGHTTNAGATVTGTNTAPQQSGWHWLHDGIEGTGSLPADHPADGNLFFLFMPVDDDGRETMSCRVHMQIAGCSLGACTTTSWQYQSLKIVFSTGPTGSVCKFDLTLTDPWGEESTADTQRFDVQ